MVTLLCDVLSWKLSGMLMTLVRLTDMFHIVSICSWISCKDSSLQAEIANLVAILIADKSVAFYFAVSGKLLNRRLMIQGRVEGRRFRHHLHRV